MTENPILIQKPRVNSRVARTGLAPKETTPLFLIHDGGGTVFSYFLLDSLDRIVYGISNPYFDTDGEPGWEDGIVSMAERYADLVRETVPSGEILLGGWSLGGLVSIQLAHLLADDPNITVKGIVMMDSHLPVKKSGVRQRKITFRSGSRTSPKMVEKLSKSMDNARAIIGVWQPPTWRSRNVPPSLAAFNQGSPSPTSEQLPPLCPPAILIRASEEQIENQETEHTVSENHIPAHSGFEYYDNFNLQNVINVPGDHFTIFEGNNIDVLTKRLKESCEILARPRFF